MLLSWDKSTQIFNTNINLIHSSNGLVFTNPSKNEDCYTFIFTKKSMSVRGRDLTTTGNNLTKIFSLVLLHRLSLLLRSNVSISQEILKDFEMTENLSLLRVQIESILRKSQLRNMFVTMAFHFEQNFGTMTDVVKGFFRYPPFHEVFFLPPLPMRKYRDLDRPIMFTNESHVVPLNFKCYDIEKYQTFVNPFPVYDREKNLIIRDITSNVCRFQARFEYQKAARAKLASTHDNNCIDYMFLLMINERYYEVVAIYPLGYVSLPSEKR